MRIIEAPLVFGVIFFPSFPFFFVFCPVPFCRAYSDAMPLYLQETGVRGGKGQGTTGVV